MPLSIEEDFDKISGGHAILDLGVPLGDAAPGLQITRLGGDPDKLGPKGWQSQPAVLEPSGTRDTGAHTQLLLGPEICDYLEEHDEIRVEVPGLGLSETTLWPFVAPSVDKDRRIGGAFTPAPPAPEPPKPPVQPTTNPKPDGPKEPTSPGTEGGSKPTPPEPEPTPEPDPKGKPVVLGLGLLAAVVAIAVVVFLLSGDDAPDPVQPTAQDPSPEELMEAARACLDNGCPAPDLTAIGTQQQEIGDMDGAYRTMSIASSRGDGGASAWLGRIHDPANFDAEIGRQTQLDGPDAARALDFYATAAEQGSPEAGGLLDTLCASLATVADETGTPPEGFADMASETARQTIEQGCTE